MDEQNFFCLVFIINEDDKIIALDVTTYYNHLEKESFIEMNKEQIFPYEKDVVKFKDYQDWFVHFGISEITEEVYNLLRKTIDNKYFDILYPGY